MRRLCIFILLCLGACSTAEPPSTDTVQSLHGDAQSAVINLNILNRDATLQSLAAESNLLFSANVGDVNTVSYTEDLNEQAFIALSDNPDSQSSGEWTIEATDDIPISYVVDVSDGSFNANLSNMNLPRFDIVSLNSMVDLALPASPFQLAVDSSDSTFNLNIPTNAGVQSAQIVSNGGLMALNVEAGVSFIGNIAITSGGLTITVPATTGVQIIIESTTNSEITLPDSPRIPADAEFYTTSNFGESDSQILLNGTLNAAAIRIVQE